MTLRGAIGAVRLRKVMRWLGKWRPNLSARSWLFTVVPSIFCLSFLFSVGPTVQQTLIGLVSSDAPTIYGSAYQDDLIDFPTLGEWLLIGVHWLYIAMAAPVIIVAARSIGFAQFIGRVGTISFIVLCLTDLLFQLVDGSLTLSQFLVNCAANFAGSALIVLLLSAIFWIYEGARSIVPTRYSNAAGAACLLLAGVLVSSVCYFTLAYFYKPVEAAFELVAKTPVHGGYFSKAAKSSDDDRAYRRPFSILPEDYKGGRGEATIAGEVGVVVWKSNEPRKTFDLSIDFFSDCPFTKDIRKLPSGRTSIVRQDVKTFALSTDTGINEVEIAENPQNGFSYTAKSPLFFWLKRPDETKPEMEAHFFGGPDAEFANRGPDEQLFYVSFGLMSTDRKAKTARIAPRNLKLVVDGDPLTLTFKRPPELDLKGKIDCGSFAVQAGTPADTVSKTIEVPEGTFIVGARVKIAPRPVDSVDVFKDNANRLNVAKANGWSQVHGVKTADLAGKLLGRADLMIIEDGLAALKIDGVTVETKLTDQFVAMGKIEGRYDKDVSLHIRGTSHALWLNGKRRNPTRWERLPTEGQLFVLTALIAALGGLWRISRPIFARFRDAHPIEGLS